MYINVTDGADIDLAMYLQHCCPSHRSYAVDCEMLDEEETGGAELEKQDLNNLYTL